MLQSDPGPLFALAIFSAVGVSHTFRPGVWKSYVGWLASQGRAGVALYASLHALPGAILMALCPGDTWPSVILFLAGVSLTLKATLYTLFPEFALGKMARGLALPDAAWSTAGAKFLMLAAVAAAG